jgi:uncharacterized glyoxalase superfamily protein PhnB
MSNAHNSITEMGSALRLGGFTQAKRLEPSHALIWGRIFFRKRKPPFEPAVHWVYAEDIDASYQELKSLGANVVDPLETKPWGLRQFTVKDLDGNLFYFHHD